MMGRSKKSKIHGGTLVRQLYAMHKPLTRGWVDARGVINGAGIVGGIHDTRRPTLPQLARAPLQNDPLIGNGTLLNGIQIPKLRKPRAVNIHFNN